MPRLPVHTARCDMTGEYEGFYLVIRKNPPMRVFEEFASGTFTRVLEALAALTRESNLVDEQGNAVDLTTVEGWREMPIDLLTEVSARVNEVLTVPKASENGSMTPSSLAKEKSPAPTT